MANGTDYYKRPGRRSQGVPGGHQEGLPQAGPQVPPRHQQGDRGGGPLQADLRGLRHALGSREAQEVRPQRLALRPGQPVRGRRGGRRRRDGRRLRRLLGHPLRHLQHDRRARRAHAAGGRARARSRDDGLALLRPGGRGRAGAGLRRHPRGLPDLPRDGRAARHEPGRVPGLPGPRRRVRGPGPVLDHPAVLTAAAARAP